MRAGLGRFGQADPLVVLNGTGRVIGDKSRKIELTEGDSSAPTVLRTGLLRDLSARTLAQVAHGGPLSPSVIWNHERLHRELLQTDNRYVSAAAELAAAALRSCHRVGSPSPSDFQS